MKTEHQVYAIKNYSRRFEVSQARRCKFVSWVPIPNDLSDLGFRKIAAQPDACNLFAAWMMMVMIASKGYFRGRLQDPDGPLSAADLAVITGYPVEIFERALVFFVDEVKWLHLVPFEDPEEVSLERPLQQHTIEKRRGNSEQTPRQLRADSENAPP